MRRVYLDSCVLRLACEAKEDDERTRRALEELNREDVTFLSSRVLELELLPMPSKNKQAGQVAFFAEFFRDAEHIACTDDALDVAMAEACRVGMSCADAMHVGLAAAGRAEELVTAEGPSKPIAQVAAVVVRSIAL